MLTSKEIEFVSYWQKQRCKNKLNPLLFVKGFGRGAILALLVIVSVAANWYKRANMVASSQLNIGVLIIALLAIATFMAWFYNYFRWEQNEQLYQELIQKQKNS